MSGMFFSKSMTFDNEDLGQAASTAPVTLARYSAEFDFVEKLRAGNADAFETLVDRFSPDIYALLFRLTSDQEETADLVQETFLQAFRSIGKFRGDSGLKTWLFRIAINESRNRFRWWKRRRRDKTSSLDATIGESETRFSDTLVEHSQSPEDNAIGREREAALLTALAKLKPIYRELIVLADIEGLSYEECAAAINVNVGTVKSRISRGREELRHRLKDF